MLLFSLLVAQTRQQSASQNDKQITFLPRSFRKTLAPQQKPLKDFQASDFYRTIIDNNLFRPLGWRPQRPRDPYRLTGTLIPTDGNTPPKAFLLATATNTTHIVTLGDKLDADTTVTAHGQCFQNGRHPPVSPYVSETDA